MSDRTRARLGLLAIAAFAVAAALLLQPFGYNQGAHLALIRALADGTPVVDEYKSFSGDLSYHDGHYYSSKAPGLAFVTLPFYLLLEAAGLPRGVHVLAVFGVVVPAILLLLLVRFVGERLEPGFGTLAAVTLGIGTLVLPFSTLFFAHVLSGLLALTAFALLWAERQGPQRLATVALAGVAAGYAVTTEYPLGLAAACLGVYALLRGDLLRRASSYAGGLLVGVAPLLAYNQWAFGSITHLSYRSERELPAGGDEPQLVLNSPTGFYGVELPDPRVAVELLLSARGLFSVTPIVVAAILGLGLLYRRGYRAEAVVIATISTLFLAYDSGFVGAFGGFGPGPRYLTPVLPLLAVTLALCFARYPVATATLAVASAGVMALATVTDVQLPNNIGEEEHGDIVDTGRWIDKLRAGDFVDSLPAHAGLGRGWLSIVPFVAAIVAAAVFATRASGPFTVARRDVGLAVFALAAWIVSLHASPPLLRADYDEGGYLGTIAVVVFAVTVLVSAVRVGRHGPAALIPAAPLAVLALPGIGDQRTLALGATCASLAALAVAVSPAGRRSRLVAPRLRA